MIKIVVLIAVAAAAFGLALAMVVRVSRGAGTTAGMILALAVLLSAALVGMQTYAIYLEQTAGRLPPDDFYNGVAGQLVIVTGMLAAIGGALGAAAGGVALWRR